MSNRFIGLLITIGAMAITSGALAQDPRSITGNAPAAAQEDQFLDYPCNDVVGHPAKCDEIDARNVAHSQHVCVDLKRQRVQCVQPVLWPPPPVQPRPGYAAQKPGPRHVVIATDYDPGPQPELVFRDQRSGITVRVQTNGRYVSAVDAQGHQLWLRDPFADSGVEPYREPVPQISWIGSTGRWQRFCDQFTHLKNGECIAVAYSSSQGGLVNLRTGEFYFMGRD